MRRSRPLILLHRAKNDQVFAWITPPGTPRVLSLGASAWGRGRGWGEVGVVTLTGEAQNEDPMFFSLQLQSEELQL